MNQDLIQKIIKENQQVAYQVVENLGWLPVQVVYLLVFCLLACASSWAFIESVDIGMGECLLGIIALFYNYYS